MKNSVHPSKKHGVPENDREEGNDREQQERSIRKLFLLRVRLQRPGLSAHTVALLFAAGQATWILTFDRFAPQRFGPLFPEVWQKLFSCVMVDTIILLAASVRPGRTVLSEFLSDATRSVIVGALL